MSSPPRRRDAALAGLASSMRTTAAPAALAARGRITGKARIGLLVGAAGEVVVDKLPAARDRIEPPQLAGRTAAGAFSGYRIAGPAGLVAGGAAAFAGTFATWRVRKLIGETTGLPDPAVAVGEDLLAATLAVIATRSSAA